jgi:hypothetical protein
MMIASGRIRRLKRGANLFWKVVQLQHFIEIFSPRFQNKSKSFVSLILDFFFFSTGNRSAHRILLKYGEIRKAKRQFQISEKVLADN